MNSVRSKYAAIAMIFVARVLAAQEGPQLDEEKRNANHIVLECKERKDADGNVAPGIEVRHELDKAMSDGTLGTHLYNPHFDGTLSPPGVAIWVFDVKGNYIGNLLATDKLRSPRREDFIRMGAPAPYPRVGRRMPLPIGGRLATDGSLLFPAMSPGKYRIQAVGFERMRSESYFSSDTREPTEEQGFAWFSRYKDREVKWRSNVLEIDIVETGKREE